MLSQSHYAHLPYSFQLSRAVQIVHSLISKNTYINKTKQIKKKKKLKQTNKKTQAPGHSVSHLTRLTSDSLHPVKQTAMYFKIV